MGISDPFNMGAAMAPAAVDTIEAHFRDLNRDPSYYDIIATGDLGKIGHDIAEEILKKDGFKFQEGVFKDCGKLIYNKDQPVFSGGSGCACSATVTYGHFFKEMKKKKLNKILVVATGALMSPMSYQQKESIPSVAHAVSIEA
ncbi:Stage V sporulation protein AD [Clostridium ljungdahlii DSM 13528]|nr:Stage V sporulation protein AD [Clostridium ljungdahlii DSM 13528]